MNRPTVFAQEYQQLLNAGYKHVVNYLLPPTTVWLKREQIQLVIKDGAINIKQGVRNHLIDCNFLEHIDLNEIQKNLWRDIHRQTVCRDHESDQLHTPEGNYETWTQYDVTRTVHESVVATSDPGRILAGGNG